MVKKLLVANRGEIAVRVMRTAAELGIPTVAVYSEADAGALHAQEADEAVCIGPPAPSLSYLNIDAILAAANATGADAIHPGYGFLAENPLFAERVGQAGLTFIGPPASAMRRLGSKTTARQAAIEAGVPVIPGMNAASDDPQVLHDAANAVGYPVLVKASAGGGGKGMRLVQSAAQLEEAARDAASEALAAFGDGAIYLEKALIAPRHVEVQILADNHGNAVHLFERECSIQRRHQKILEETPSVALTPALREQMGQAAVAVAKAAGYVNAGTVEFLLDAAGRFYFLEVNTRLQVEHPITEMVTGLDLVALQIAIARGAPLPFSQREVAMRGHAIECRIYAEDPENGFLPSPGRVHLLEAPQGPFVRFDAGIRTGQDVPVHYDPILGKLVVWAEDRPAAIRRMLRALKHCVILGVKTPIEFLIDVLRSEAFQAGNTSTDFIDTHFSEWKPSAEADEIAEVSVAALDMTRPKGREAQDFGEPGSIFRSPWQRLGAFDSAN